MIYGRSAFIEEIKVWNNFFSDIKYSKYSIVRYYFNIDIVFCTLISQRKSFSLHSLMKARKFCKFSNYVACGHICSYAMNNSYKPVFL